MIFRRFALLLVVVGLLGCNNEKNRNLIDHRADQAIQIGREAVTPAPKKSYNPLVVSDKVWSGNSSTRLRRGIPLPGKYEGTRGVTLIASEPMELSQIAVAISTQTGIPIRLVDGASSGGGRSGGGPGAEAPSMTLAYEGALSGLLDLVAANFGINWRYDGSSIKISRFETRVFTIEALPGSQTIKDGIKEGGESSEATASGGGGSSSPLEQSSSMSIEIRFWDELNQTLTSMLGGVGTIVLSPSTGTATVTTTPELMQTVAKYIEEENRRMTRQIAINVEIYSVALSEDTDFNVTFNTALRRLTGLGGNIASASGPANATEGLGSLSVAILNPASTGEINSVFSALSSVGDTTRVSQFPLTTLNNRPVSRRVGRDVTYVREMTNTTTSDSLSSSSITAGNIREGFSLQLTPRLLDDGRIMLQYSFSLIDIVEMPSFDTGSGTIQLPETSSRVFVQQAMLRSGSTLIVGGYDDESVSQTSSGVGSAYNYFLGGGSVNAKARAMMFIAITPQVLEPSKAEHE